MIWLQNQSSTWGLGCPGTLCTYGHPYVRAWCSSQSHNSRSQCHCPREHRGPWVGQMGHLPGLHSGTLLGTLRCCSAYNHCKLHALNRGDKNIPTPACHLSVSVQPLQLTGSKLCTEMSLTILSHTQYPSASRTTSHSFPPDRWRSTYPKPVSVLNKSPIHIDWTPMAPPKCDFALLCNKTNHCNCPILKAKY